jgi:uncharacterized protein
MLPKKPTFAVKCSKTGLGLFALQTIPANKRIIEYQGKILTNEESVKAGGKYLFTLDDQRVIDGRARSNLARYINHSCQPNARAHRAGNHVWIWSLREIEAGEEVALDYGQEYFDAYIRQKGCK